MAEMVVIGAGFSGLSAAAYLAAAGHDVHVYEQHGAPGGRARQIFTSQGYVFDMGPSWYWMPDVFEKFFQDFGSSVDAHYALTRLDPAFEMVFAENDSVQIPSRFEDLLQLFDSIEPGSGHKLLDFMREAERKYRIGMHEFVYKPSLSMMEYLSPRMMKEAWRMDLFSSFRRHVRKYFQHPHLQALMEFPVLFLGAKPDQTPSLYSLMNYAGLQLGTWYPQGGFGKVIAAMESIARQHGAQFHYHQEVQSIRTQSGSAVSLLVNDQIVACDAIVASADYAHVEGDLLRPGERNYSDRYWKQKVFAPSCLIYYIGVRKKIDRLLHHTLFFDEDLDQHAHEIYATPGWPSKPLFYVCCPSKSDDTVAPDGHENLFLLMPLAAGIEDSTEQRERYFEIMMARLESFTGTSIRSHIDYRQSYCLDDYVRDYHAYKGNAYGLANTLQQTALLKPKMRNRHIHNLYYTGQLTVPGPGVPSCIISGKVAAQLVNQTLVPA